jgi:hypothetical protein
MNNERRGEKKRSLAHCIFCMSSSIWLMRCSTSRANNSSLARQVVYTHSLLCFSLFPAHSASDHSPYRNPPFRRSPLLRVNQALPLLAHHYSLLPLESPCSGRQRELMLLTNLRARNLGFSWFYFSQFALTNAPTSFSKSLYPSWCLWRSLQLLHQQLSRILWHLPILFIIPVAQSKHSLTERDTDWARHSALCQVVVWQSSQSSICIDWARHSDIYARCWEFGRALRLLPLNLTCCLFVCFVFFFVMSVEFKIPVCSYCFLVFLLLTDGDDDDDDDEACA